MVSSYLCQHGSLSTSIVVDGVAEKNGSTTLPFGADRYSFSSPNETHYVLWKSGSSISISVHTYGVHGPFPEAEYPSRNLPFGNEKPL